MFIKFISYIIYTEQVQDNIAQFNSKCLQCFDSVGWAAGRPPKTEWWDAGVVICVERGAELHNYGLADATATH